MILIDTNLLVYAHRRGCPEHMAARAAIEKATRARRGWAVAFPCLAEFWMVVTHPSCVGGPSTADEAAGFLASLVSTGGARILGARAAIGSRLIQAAVERRIAGPRIFDLQIALIGLDGGASAVWTHDAGFVSLPGLAVVDPLGG